MKRIPQDSHVPHRLDQCALIHYIHMMAKYYISENIVPPERQLLNRITTNYSTITRPKLNSTAPIDVTLRLKLLSVEEFVSLTMTLSLCISLDTL